MSTLRIATFNTLYPNAREPKETWPRRRELIRRAIDRAHPDAIGLQEVLPETLADLPSLTGTLAFVPGPDRGPARPFSPYPVVEPMMRFVRTGTLAAPPGAALGPNRTSAEHLPIAYRADRLRPLESGAFWISATPERPQSSLPFAFSPYFVHWVRFADLVHGPNVLLLNAHLGHAPWHHLPEARIITGRIRALSPLEPVRAAGSGEPMREHVILLGDFNALRSTSLLRVLTSPAGAGLIDAGRHAPSQSGPAVTFHWGVGAERWGVTIDYVLARASLQPRSCERLNERDGTLWASDHHLVVVEFEDAS